MITVGFFFGGQSVEHEISVISALQAMHALDTSRYQAVPIYLSKEGNWYSGDALWDTQNYKNIPRMLKSCREVYLLPKHGDHTLYSMRSRFGKKASYCHLDVAFPILHGTKGEDGSIQGLFELNGIPYIGCDVLASAVGMDKVLFKKILKESGLPVVDYEWFTSNDWKTQPEQVIQKAQKLSYPIIVKPANLGSSVGISPAQNEEELHQAIDLATVHSERVLLEKMLSNFQEINCAVLGNSHEQVYSVCEEPIKSDDFLSYQDKYQSESNTKGSKAGGGMSSTKRIIPAPIEEEQKKKVYHLAQQVFSVLGAVGTSRIDFLLSQEGIIYVNEINTIPGSLSFYLWEPTGIPFGELLHRLISLALDREREHRLLSKTYDQNIFSTLSDFQSGKQ